MLSLSDCALVTLFSVSVANISHSSNEGLQNMTCGEKNDVLSLSMKGLFSIGSADWV